VVNAIVAAAAVAIARFIHVCMFALDWLSRPSGGSLNNLGAARGAMMPRADYIFAR
jgi:hypothetical protein